MSLESGLDTALGKALADIVREKKENKMLATALLESQANVDHLNIQLKNATDQAQYLADRLAEAKKETDIADAKAVMARLERQETIDYWINKSHSMEAKANEWYKKYSLLALQTSQWQDIILGLEITIDNYEARLHAVNADATVAKKQYEYWMGEVLLARQNRNTDWKKAAEEWKSKALSATRDANAKEDTVKELQALISEYEDMITKLATAGDVLRQTVTLGRERVEDLQHAMLDAVTMVLNMDAETLDDTADLLEDVGVDSKNVRSYVAGVLHAVEVATTVLGGKANA